MNVPRPCSVPRGTTRRASCGRKGSHPSPPLAKSVRGRGMRRSAHGRCRLSARAVASRPSAERVQTEGPDGACVPSGLTLSAACSRSERRGRKPRPDARAASLPTPSPFRLRRLLQDFARLFSSSFVGGVTDSEPSRSANRCLSRLIAPSARRPAPSRAREDPAKLLPHLAALLRRAHHRRAGLA